MIDQKTADLICSVAGKFDVTGRHYMGASYWFRSKYANGFEEFSKYEAKERWRYSGKLYRYVADRGFQPLIQAGSAVQNSGWSGVDVVIDLLKKHDESTMQVLSGVVKQMIDQGMGAVGLRLSSIENYFQKDLKEILSVADHVTTKNAMLEMVNDNLYQEYGGNHCSCSK